MNPIARTRATGLALAFVVYGLDRWVKYLVMYVWKLHINGNGPIEVLPFFDLRFTQNYGVSLGMLTADSAEMRWMLVAMTGLISLVVLVWMLREKKAGDIYALALILGGAAGNIRDRRRDHTAGAAFCGGDDMMPRPRAFQQDAGEGGHIRTPCATPAATITAIPAITPAHRSSSMTPI